MLIRAKSKSLVFDSAICFFLRCFVVFYGRENCQKTGQGTPKMHLQERIS